MHAGLLECEPDPDPHHEVDAVLADADPVQQGAETEADEGDGKRSLTLVGVPGSLGVEQLGKRRGELMIRGAQGQVKKLADWRDGR